MANFKSEGSVACSEILNFINENSSSSVEFGDSVGDLYSSMSSDNFSMNPVAESYFGGFDPPHSFLEMYDMGGGGSQYSAPDSDIWEMNVLSFVARQDWLEDYDVPMKFMPSAVGAYNLSADLCFLFPKNVSLNSDDEVDNPLESFPYFTGLWVPFELTVASHSLAHRAIPDGGDFFLGTDLEWATKTIINDSFEIAVYDDTLGPTDEEPLNPIWYDAVVFGQTELLRDDLTPAGASPMRVITTSGITRCRGLYSTNDEGEEVLTGIVGSLIWSAGFHEDFFYDSSTEGGVGGVANANANLSFGDATPIGIDTHQKEDNVFRVVDVSTDQVLNTVTTKQEAIEIWQDLYNVQRKRYKNVPSAAQSSDWAHLMLTSNAILGIIAIISYFNDSMPSGHDLKGYFPRFSMFPSFIPKEYRSRTHIPQLFNKPYFYLDNIVDFKLMLGEEKGEIILNEIDKCLVTLQNTINNNLDIRVNLMEYFTKEQGSGGTLAACAPQVLLHGNLKPIPDGWTKAAPNQTRHYIAVKTMTVFIDLIDLQIDRYFEIVRNDNTRFYYVFLHELMHGLGVGGFWNHIGYNSLNSNLYDLGIEYNNTDIDQLASHYTGEHGVEQFQLALTQLGYGGSQYFTTYIAAQGHEDDESTSPRIGGHIATYPQMYQNKVQPTLYNELMAPYVQDNITFSRVTIGLLEDLGYDVNYDTAESTSLLAVSTDTSYQLLNDQDR